MSQSPNEIFDLLDSWGLGDLKAKFKANYIVLQALEFLTEADIIELIPKIGQRAIFRARLNQWRAQKFSPNKINVPEPKKIKLEPGSELKSPQQQLPHEEPIAQQLSPQPLLQPNDSNNIHGNASKIIPKPRTKRAYNRRANTANNSNNAQTPNMQSRVHKFIIGSPPATTMTAAAPTGTGICRLPSPPGGTRINISSPTSLFYNLPPNIECRRFPTIVQPRPTAPSQNHTSISAKSHTPVSAPIYIPGPNQIQTPVATRVINSDNLSNVNSMAHNSPARKNAPTFAADLTPFATSIIRVETNCETQYPTTGDPSPQNPITKFKRTTIIQKLTPDQKTSPPQTKMPKPMLMPRPIEKLQTPPQVTRSAKPRKSPEVPKPKTIVIPKEEPIEIIEDDENTLDATDWNDFCEKRTNPEQPPLVEKESQAKPELANVPEPEVVPEPELPEAELDPEPNPEVEEFTLADNVTELPDLIKDELVDSDSRSDQEDNDNNNDKDLLEEMKDFKDSKNPRDTQEPKVDINRLDIRGVLMNSKMGRRVIKRYVAEEILDEQSRRLLIETIAQYCFDNKIHITPTYCKDIAEEIIEIFPNERMDDYYVRKGKKLRPPIYTKFHAIRRYFFRKRALTDPKPNTNKESDKKSSSAQENDYDDDDNLIIS